MRKILLTIMFFSFTIGCAHNSHQGWSDEMLHTILQQKEVCVYHSDTQRIYFNPEKIYLTAQGALLKLDDHMIIPIHNMNVDSEGCYIGTYWDVNPRNKCSGCGQEYLISCNNPSCPLVKAAKAKKEATKKKKSEQKESDKKTKADKKTKKNK